MGTWSCFVLCHKERSAGRLYSLRTKHQLRSGVRPTTAVSWWPWSWNCTEILHQTLIGAQIFLLTFLSKNVHTGSNANSCSTAVSSDARNILDLSKERISKFNHLSSWPRWSSNDRVHDSWNLNEVSQCLRQSPPKKYERSGTKRWRMFYALPECRYRLKSPVCFWSSRSIDNGDPSYSVSSSGVWS